MNKYPVHFSERYETGKYAIEYMTCVDDKVLAELNVGETKIKLIARGKGEIKYRGRLYSNEEELTDDMRRHIADGSDDVEIIRLTKFYFVYQGMEQRNNLIYYFSDLLPPKEKMESVLVMLMRSWVSTLMSEGLTGEKELEFMEAPCRYCIVRGMNARLEPDLVVEHLLLKFLENEETFMYTDDFFIGSEEDIHGVRWLTIAFTSSNSNVQNIVRRATIEYGKEMI